MWQHLMSSLSSSSVLITENFVARSEEEKKLQWLENSPPSSLCYERRICSECNFLIFRKRDCWASMAPSTWRKLPLKTAIVSCGCGAEDELNPVRVDMQRSIHDTIKQFHKLLLRGISAKYLCVFLMLSPLSSEDDIFLFNLKQCKLPGTFFPFPPEVVEGKMRKVFHSANFQLDSLLTAALSSYIHTGVRRTWRQKIVSFEYLIRASFTFSIAAKTKFQPE